MARDGGPTPALGWCDPALRKHPIERFVSRTRIFDTKRANEDFWVTFQTTPVPLRDRRRCAALVPLVQGGPYPGGCSIFSQLPVEEGRAMARDGGPTPAPGWCDPVLRKHPIERFMS